jgi:Holliday junction resolvasome RuvABC endonuclease subunit
MIFVGIDPGINKTGVVGIQDGRVVFQKLVSIEQKEKLRRFDFFRVENMRMTTMAAVFAIAAREQTTDQIIVGLEEPFVGASASGALKQYSVFVALALDLNREFGVFIVAPTTLKKFVGAKEKNFVARQVFKRWEYEAADDNLVDAYAIARWAESEWNAPKP